MANDRLSGMRVLVLMAVAGALFGANTHADEDWQFWFDADGGGTLSDKVSVHTKLAIRLKEDVGALSTYFADVGIRHKTAPWLSLGLYYRQQYDKSSADGTWLEENRPHVDATVKWKWRGIQFSDRNRVEYRVREERDDEFRYRNKLTELFQRKFTGWHLQPYMAQEVFLDEGANPVTEASRVRLFFGLRGDPEDRFRFLGVRPTEGRRFKSDWYLMYDSQKQGDDSVNAFMVSLKLGVFF